MELQAGIVDEMKLQAGIVDEMKLQAGIVDEMALQAGIVDEMELNVQLYAPDDGQRNRPKHVESFGNKSSKTVASCWL